MKNENIVNLIEQLVDLKARQTLRVRDLFDSTTYRQSQVDTEMMQRVKRLLVNALDS